MADLGAIGVGSQRTGVLYGGMVSGIVHDEAGAPAAHYVLAYHRGSGQPSGGTKSDPATGAYTILTSTGFGVEEHFVIELNPTGAENHRIRGFVTPNKGY